MPSNIKCYSVRQFSPFVGSIQIVQADYCRALSSDGTQWQIQASCETQQQVLNISNNKYIPRRYVLYGSWSKKSGLSCLPLDPMLDVPSLQHIESTLVNTLLHCADKLPFTPHDCYECWLIDQHTSLPLAIVHSVTHEYMIPHIHDKPWQAIPQQQALNSLPDSLSELDIAKLERHLNQQTINYHWYYRGADRSGISTLDTKNQLSADSFPELLFNSTLLPSSLQTIASHLIDWLSPRLLGLHSLSLSNRLRLEQSAQYYAVETSKRLAVYPHPLSDNILKKILVEMKIRGH